MNLINEGNQFSSDTSDNKESINKEEKNKKFITIGKCSHFYLFILGSSFSKFLTILIMGEKKKNIGLFGFSPILASYNNVQSMYTYIGYIIFGIIIFYFLKGKNNIFTIKKNQNQKRFLIHNINKMSVHTPKTFIQIFFCFGFYIEAINILYSLGFQSFNYWTFETIFTFLLMKKYFVVDIYRHHKCSIIFIFVTSTICLLIASFLPNSSYGGEQNAYQFIDKDMGSYFYFMIITLFFVFLSFNYSFSRTFSKVVMQFKFLSPYKLIILIGAIGFIISLIDAIILYYINVGANTLQFLSDLNTCEKDYKFYLEIFLIYPIFIFAKFLQIYFEIMTIYYLNPIYTLMINNLTYSSSKLFFFILNGFNDVANFLLSDFSEIFAIIGYVIYLEIVELNFCGLSDNIKRNIISKGENEFNEIKIERYESIISSYDNIDNIVDDEEENDNDNESKTEEMIDKKKK